MKSKDPEILFFNLKRDPFKVMVTGEKNEEFRSISSWMNARLLNKDGTPKSYKLVKFVLGMGDDKPFFICKFNGFKIVSNINKQYSNGLTVNAVGDLYSIQLGEIVSTGNLNHPYLKLT